MVVVDWDAAVHYCKYLWKYGSNHNSTISYSITAPGSKFKAPKLVCLFILGLIPRLQIQSGLVFNSICATLILAEPFTRLSLVGTVLVCLGATLIATFGAMKEPAHSLDELLGLLAGVPFLVWMGAQAIIVFGILIATKMSSVMRPKQVHTPKMKMVRGVAYGCVRYGFTVVYTKSLRNY